MLALAREWSFSADDVRQAHETYVSMLVATALDDGVVTKAERRDIDLVAGLLGVSDKTVNGLLRKKPKKGSKAEASKKKPKRAAQHESLDGKSVCFTGNLAGPDGKGIKRPDAATLAEESGLKFAKSVSKKLDILVMADPDSASGKASKAKKYGTRIMAEAAFWRAIGAS